MALAHSPRIVTDGLVFYYDMNNPWKSWRGAPVENLAKTASNQIDWSVSNLTQIVSRSTVIENERYRITSTSNTGTSFRIRFNNAPLVNGETYTVSYRYRFISGGPTFRANDWCDQSIVRITTPETNGAFRESATGSRATYDSTFRFLDFEISNNSVVEIWDLQLEERTFATPYSSNRTRSNTEAVLDLTNKHQLTANNLTYTSDGLFEFSNGSINVPFSNDFDFSKEQTIFMWLHCGPTSSSARRNPYNQAYGGSGTITHEPGRTFNYYFGTHGGNSTPYVGRGSGFTVDPNELACIAVTRNQDTDTVRWFKNGVLITTASAGGYTSTNNGSSPILIGNGYTNNFQGKIPSVCIYNKELTPDQVRQNFNATRGRYGI